MIVSGHGLMNEGAAFNADGTRVMYNTVSGVGHALCACGVMSEEPLPSSGARRRWHKEHKAAVAAA